MTQQSSIGKAVEPSLAIAATHRLTQPSLLWKAYAHSLLPFLSLRPDLSQAGQALFIASPLQPGIPANDIVPEAVTNYQQYLKADCMQIRNDPFYSLENGSYFDQLWAQVPTSLPACLD